MKTGIPVSLGYLAVSFTLGITAKRAGLTALQAACASLLVNASAGEYAAFTLIAAQASYLSSPSWELVANARYLLMSCALSQKLDHKTGLGHRMAIGFAVTDELFGLSILEPEKLNPMFYYGMMACVMPGWALGTFLGVVMGSVLPASVVSALSVGLYGMFLAVIIPQSRKSRTILIVVVLSMAASLGFDLLPSLAAISSGTKTIILTLVIASGAAILAPVALSPEWGGGRMKHNIYLYILVITVVTYLIRVLPLTLIRREIRNRFFAVVFCTICRM